MNDIAVISPNLNHRLSGVTATVISLTPLLARKVGIVTTGTGLPKGLPYLPFWRLLLLKRRLRIWHARRNNELLLGILLQSVGLMRLKLVFTSSSPRKRRDLTNWMTRRCDALVATTKANAAVMPIGCRIIPHGVNTKIFAPGVPLDFGTGKEKLIGCFGRVRPMKGTHHFVDAMCRLLPDHPGVSALIMGRITAKNEQYAKKLKTRIKEAGLQKRILFKDELPLVEMPAAYRALHLYVTPSLLEGYGLTALEALATGVPVVATNVGAFSDFVSQDCGKIVAPDDPHALTRAISDMLSSELSAMGCAGRARVIDQFDLENEADALVSLYRELLGAEKVDT